MVQIKFHKSKCVQIDTLFKILNNVIVCILLDLEKINFNREMDEMEMMLFCLGLVLHLLVRFSSKICGISWITLYQMCFKNLVSFGFKF